MSSNEKLANGTTGYKITKDDLAQINRRNLLGFQDGWNYERMQHSGYLWIILPTLRKLYGDGTPELKEACRAQCAPFFNTSNFLNTIITGIDLAIEEEEGSEASAAEIQEIVSLIRKYDIPAIFTEVNGSDATAQAISRETGCEVYQLDMIMSGDGTGIQPYIDAMQKNMDTIVEALG